MDAELDTFIDKLESVQSIEAGRQLLTESLGNLGFDQFAYLGLRLPNTSLAEPVLVHSYDQEWVDRYLEKDYACVDPVVERGLASVVPFGWGGDKHRKVLESDSRTMMDEASEFGLTQGFTIPIHGTDGELAAFSIAVPDQDYKTNKHISAFSHEVHLMALYFHGALGEKILSEGKPPKISLSKREAECLLWAAQGKTAWEISEILKISEHTVREYIKNSCNKLGVYSKSHAIVKSIMLGLIKPNMC